MAISVLDKFLNKVGITNLTKEEREQLKIEERKKEIIQLNRKRYNIKTSMNLFKMMRNIVESVLGLAIFYNFITLHFTAAFICIGGVIVTTQIFSFIKRQSKDKLTFIDQEIQYLNGEIGIEDLNSFNKEKYKDNNSENLIKEKNVYDAEIVEDDEETEVYNATSKYSEFVPEAQKAFIELEELNNIIYGIASHDNELYILFRNTYNLANKTADLIKVEKLRENRAYKFYNYVDMLFKWAKELNDLYSKDVYESLLTNLKTEAKSALPILQSKINGEYYKLVNPQIMDLESEMNMMSKEV